MGVVGGPGAVFAVLGPVGAKDVVELSFQATRLEISATSQFARYVTAVALEGDIGALTTVCVNGKDLVNAVACCESAVRLAIVYDADAALVHLTGTEDEVIDFGCAIHAIHVEPHWLELGAAIAKIKMDTEIMYLAFLQCVDSSAGPVRLQLRNDAGMALATSWQNGCETSVTVPASLMEISALPAGGLELSIPAKELLMITGLLSVIGGPGGMKTEMSVTELGVRFVRKVLTGFDSYLDILAAT